MIPRAARPAATPYHLTVDRQPNGNRELSADRIRPQGGRAWPPDAPQKSPTTMAVRILNKRKHPPRITDQYCIDLFLRDASLTHRRNHILEDMSVPPPAVTGPS